MTQHLVWIFRATVICAIAMAAALPARAEAGADGGASGPPPVVVFLGDSLTAGYGLAPTAALPDQVERRLAARGIVLKAVNAGVSGDTAANGLARFHWSVASLDADLVVVALGANDFLLGIAPEETRANLATIVEQARDLGIAVVLAGLELRSTRQPGSREDAFADVYANLAAAYDVPFYPALLKGVRDQPHLLQPDGLHPTAEGVEVMADNLSAFLMPLVKDLSP